MEVERKLRRSRGSRLPSSAERGEDARSRESREATLARADGVVWPRNFLTTPPRPSATPPPAEEGSRLLIVSAWLLKRLNLVRHT